MINATIEARLGSTRFPNKILKKISNKTFLEFQINRIKKSKYLSKIIVATTNKKNDKKIINLCKKKKIEYYSGSNENVLKRIFMTHKKYKSQIVVRLCSDNPFQDPKMIDDSIKEYLKKKNDIVCYGGSPKTRKIPYGFDIEVLSFDLLNEAYKLAKNKIHLEHPTKYLYDVRKNLKIKFLKPTKKSLYFPKLTFALDYPDQQIFLKKILLKVKNNYANYKKLVMTVKKTPELMNMAKILSEKYILNRKY